MAEKGIKVMMAINRAHRIWMKHTKEVALEIGIPDPYRTIIMHLARRPGANQKQLAEVSNKTTAAVNQTIKDMIADGFVRKETDDSDRRYTKLYLTEKGMETSERLKERLRISDEAISKLITPEREQEVIELLDKISDYIQRELSSC